MTPMKLAHTARDAFQTIGVTTSRGWQLVREGKLATYKEGRRRMVTQRECERYIAAREQEANPALARPKRRAA